MNIQWFHSEVVTLWILKSLISLQHTVGRRHHPRHTPETSGVVGTANNK